MGDRTSLKTLKRRSEYLRLRGGLRVATPSFVIEGKRRHPAETSGARFGFTVTRRLGNAVVRNRIRRRLKEVARLTLDAAAPDFDYVVVGREVAETIAFDELLRAFRRAVTTIGRKSSETGPGPASSRLGPT